MKLAYICSSYIVKRVLNPWIVNNFLGVLHLLLLPLHQIAVLLLTAWNDITNSTQKRR